jgi:hypothetical protein
MYTHFGITKKYYLTTILNLSKKIKIFWNSDKKQFYFLKTNFFEKETLMTIKLDYISPKLFFPLNLANNYDFRNLHKVRKFVILGSKQGT